MSSTARLPRHRSTVLSRSDPDGIVGTRGEHATQVRSQYADTMNSLTLPGDPRSVAHARAFVRQMAVGHVEDIEAATLMVSELVANVVEHARTAVTLRVETGPPFRVEVHDSTAASNAFRAMIAECPPVAAASVPRGRGIGLVHRLATRIGLDDDPDGGKVVWFEL